MADKILIRGDTLDNWLRRNPILSGREIAIVFDGAVINGKVGDGFTRFDQLEYTWYDIKINGKRIRPRDTGSVDIPIPEKTGDMVNNGNGDSNGVFTTKKYVDDADTALQSKINTENAALLNEIGSVNTALLNKINAVDNFHKSENEAIRNEISGLSGSSGGTAGAKKYTKTFNSSGDWSGSGPYTITVTAATHAAGTEVIADLLVLNQSVYQKSIGYPGKGYVVSVAANGNVTVTANTRFAGKLVIIG